MALLRTWKIIVGAALLLVATAAIYWTGIGNDVMAAGNQSVVAASPEPGPAPSVGAPAPAPVPPVKEQAPPKPPAWEKAPALQQAVSQAMAGFPGRYSIVVYDLKADKQFAVNETERFHPASTIKMPVALYALEQHRAGKLGWNDLIQYTEADFESPGGGAFEKEPFGGLYPVENLVGRSLRYSNNVAVNMLGRHLGWENIRAWTRSIDGELWREPDASPSVNALSELGWWRHLERLTRQDPKMAELLMAPLREVGYDGRIAAGLPDGVKFVHKFGSYDGSYHDTGWVMGDKPFLLIVLTHGATVDEADAAIAGVTKVIYEVMMQ
jgi:beta-lactamase class A